MPLVNFWGMTSHLISIGICSRRICQDDAVCVGLDSSFFWCCLCWQPGDSTMQLSSSLLVAKNSQVVAELKPEEREHVTEAGELFQHWKWVKMFPAVDCPMF